MDTNEQVTSLMAAFLMRKAEESGHPIDATLAQKLASSCTSFWLKDAIRSSLKRDPVDAWNDVATLAEIMHDIYH